MKIAYRPAYHISLKNVLEYSVDTFGKRVADDFKSEIRQKIERLRTMPNMCAMCRFIDSSETKVYRNIIVRSYLIIYSVTDTQVTVIDIIHSSTSPENIRNRIE